MSITLKQIHASVTRVKPVSRRQLFRYLKRLKIKPVGMRTVPRLYPDDAADLIVTELGVPTMAQLRDLRRRSMSAKSRAQNRRAV